MILGLGAVGASLGIAGTGAGAGTSRFGFGSGSTPTLSEYLKVSPALLSRLARLLTPLSLGAKKPLPL